MSSSAPPVQSLNMNIVPSSVFNLKNKKLLLLILVAVLLLGAGTYYYFSRSKEGYKSNAKFVLYYAEWCGHSQTMLEIWKDFVTQAKENSNLSNLTLEKIDCDKNDDVCKEKKINGYPTMILHKDDGESIEYDSSRDVEALIKWCEAKLDS